jgi:hypothetical protein
MEHIKKAQSVQLLVRMRAGLKHKGNVVPVHTTETSRGADTLLHSFLISAVDEGECPTCFTLGKNSPHPFNTRLDGSQSWAKGFGDKKNLSPELEFEHWIVQLTHLS